MGNELLRLLGLKPNDADIQDAMQDARAAEHLIDALVEMRTRLGITQSQLAQLMETTQSSVSKFERAGGDPHLSTLLRYARAVGGRLRFVVDASEPRPSNWTATYRIGAPVDPAEDSEVDTVVVPLVGQAS